MVREGPAQGAQRGDPGEQIAEAEGAQDEEGRTSGATGAHAEPSGAGAGGRAARSARLVVERPSR